MTVNPQVGVLVEPAQVNVSPTIAVNLDAVDRLSERIVAGYSDIADKQSASLSALKSALGEVGEGISEQGSAILEGFVAAGALEAAATERAAQLDVATRVALASREPAPVEVGERAEKLGQGITVALLAVAGVLALKG